QLNERDLNIKSDVFKSASNSSVNESEEDNNQANDRYKAGTACLPNAAIFDELARIGRKQRKENEVPHTEPQTEKHIPTPSHDPLPSGEDKIQLSKLMEICIKFPNTILSLEKIKTNQAAKIEKLKKRVKKLKGKKKKRTYGLMRLYKVGLTTRVESSEEEEGVVDATTIAAATTPQISKDELTLAQTLMEIKEAKPKAKGVTIQEPGEFRTTSPSQSSQPPQAKDKGKGIMMEHDKPLKKKDQIALDEEATIDADKQLAKQLQAHERKELSIKEKSKLLAKLIESRRKYFATKRDKEIRNKPPIKAQQKSLICTYMKNIKGYKQKEFKGKSFDAIKKTFDKVYMRVNTFIDMNTEIVEEILKKTQAEVTEGSSKRAREEIEQESARRQRLEKEDDTIEHKRCLEIVPEDDDDVTI
nr:hypothetical protein [Tanacetum cinerariifolium]